MRLNCQALPLWNKRYLRLLIRWRALRHMLRLVTPLFRLQMWAGTWAIASWLSGVFCAFLKNRNLQIFRPSGRLPDGM